MAQGLVLALAVASCILLQHRELIWGTIALVVSLHFIPIGRLVHVRAYHATGLAGSTVALVALWRAQRPNSLLLLTIGMGTVVWSGALYLLLNAERIAERALVREGVLRQVR